MASVTARVNRDGSLTWRVQARVAGKMRQESFLEQKGAQQFAALVDRVGFDAARQTRYARQGHGPQALTLRDWAARYLDPSQGYLVGVTPATVRSYKLAAERSFLPLLGDLPLEAITAAEVGRWLHWQTQQINPRTGAPLAAKTLRNHHAVLSAMLTAATQAGHARGNAARGARIGRGTPQEMTLITPDEFEAIYAELPDWAQPLARFLVGTGMRWGEATALTWADIDLAASPATARITKAWKRGENGSPVLGTTKTSKSVRTVSLPPLVVEAMLPRRAPAELVFPGPFGIGQQAWTKRFHRLAWHPAVKASGIGKRPRVHDLRHAQSSWLIAQGVPLPWIQQRLGHEKVTTTVDTYGHLTPEAHEQMALVMERVFDRARPPALSTPRSLEAATG